jgi:hypothetical protein
LVERRSAFRHALRRGGSGMVEGAAAFEGCGRIVQLLANMKNAAQVTDICYIFIALMPPFVLCGRRQFGLLMLSS